MAVFLETSQKCFSVLNREDLSYLSEQQCLDLCSYLLKYSGNIVNQFTSHHFILFIHLLENESPYVSYSAKELIANLFKLFTSQKVGKQLEDIFILISQYVSQRITQILEQRTTNDVALMHTFNLVEALLDRGDELHEEKTGLRQRLVEHWNVLSEYAFSSQCGGDSQESLIHSILKMYIKLIKTDHEMMLASTFKLKLTQNLLEKLRSDKVPESCLRKALMIIFHCCPEIADSKTSKFNNNTSHVSSVFFALTENHDPIDSVGEHNSLPCGLHPWLCNIVMRETPCRLFIGRGNSEGSGLKSCDNQLLATALLVVAKYTAYLTGCEISEISSKNLNDNFGAEKVWNRGFNFTFNVIEFFFPCSLNQFRQLINVLCEQDDIMIKFLLFNLQTAISSGSDNILTGSHEMFLSMLLMIHWNHSILVDWLTSPETVFLRFFLKLSKSILSKPELWKNACHSFDKSFGLTSLTHGVGNSWQIATNISPESNRKINQYASFNLTAYSDSEDSNEENEMLTPTLAASGFSITKSRDVFIATAESIEKLKSVGCFPYNPAALLRLLNQFHDL